MFGLSVLSVHPGKKISIFRRLRRFRRLRKSEKFRPVET
jgi:hypothetical protein